MSMYVQPGIDEIVALLQIFQLGEETDSNGKPRFERIVIDTAPTGHTVRLLQLPDFLNSMTGKLIIFRSKITGAIDSFKSLFGGKSAATTNTSSQGNPLDKLEKIQANLQRMQKSLRDPMTTQFVIVSIPTTLAVEESKRLLTSLQTENILVSNIICNQVISEQMSQKYLSTRSSAQRNAIGVLNSQAKWIQPDIEISEVPYVDTEV